MSKRRWNARTQMLLTLELAIVLPATALIGYNVWHLRSIQRDRAVEAAIQRDFIHVLKIAEKRMNSQAYKAVEDCGQSSPARMSRPFRSWTGSWTGILKSRTSFSTITTADLLVVPSRGE